MKPSQHTDVAVIGAGIAGLATAYALAKEGQRVVVFERNPRASGASVRNFGMIWPIGQAPGLTYQRALRSREIWTELAAEAGFWLSMNGSLHLAYHADERAVLEEFADTAVASGFRQCDLLTPEQTLRKSPAVKAEGLKGALWSDTEMTVDPRQVIRELPAFLEARYGVTFRFGTAVNAISSSQLITKDEQWTADRIFVCSGADFETLYPEIFAQQAITKCKLQMMRTATQPDDWRIGPSLCAGLTLRHYSSFKHCTSLPAYDQRIRQESPWFDQWGIHVLLSQNGLGELVIGDSHEYGWAPEPFDKEEINRHILTYLHTFLQAPDTQIAERWHGIYPKLTNGATELVLQPEKNVTIINGLGGAGMTLSFGLAEEVVKETYRQPAVVW